jgi:phenylacetate-CoA ligase
MKMSKGDIMNKNPMWLMHDIDKARKQGIAAIEQRQHTRFIEMVDFARSHSSYYRHLYQQLPAQVNDVEQLPITSKKDLMAHFDEWVTDPEVTLEQVRSFVDQPELAGERFLNKYFIATTSGTTGAHGLFLFDDQSLAVNAAFASRAMRDWLGTRGFFRLLTSGARTALIVAEGGHFIAFAGMTHILKKSPWLRKFFKVFSVHLPLLELVSELNRFQPAIIIGYGSVLSLLASEQATGRLDIHPILLEPAGESLKQGEHDRIARLFNAKVRDLYGATECQFISSRCIHGWYHIKSDWVIVEPVDRDYQPVQAGEQSHTVLITNLANRVQPILRYDLGDSLRLRPDPCPCGNPLPAIRVQGRAADVLSFPTDERKLIQIAPLAFVTLVDRTPGVEMFQIVQTAPTSLRIRLQPITGADPEQVWQAVSEEISHMLAAHKLSRVSIERGREPPEQSPGGKFRTIIPLSSEQN